MDRQYVILENARKFLKNEIRPFVKLYDEEGVLPREIIEKVALNGYLGAAFPEKYGGLNLDDLHYGLLIEEFGKVCSSLRSLLTVHTSLVGQTILKWGTEEQKNYWLPLMAKGEKIGAFALTEPEIGSDAKNVQTKFDVDGNCFLLNGTKKWITFGEIADFYLVTARNNQDICTFIVEKNKSIEITPIKGLIGSRASHPALIKFKNVKVPSENLLGPMGGGFRYIVNSALDYGRYNIAWAGLAIAQEALECMVSYSRERIQFGSSISHYQHIKAMIADSVTMIKACRVLCTNVAKLRMEKDPDYVSETNIAKYFASKTAVITTKYALQIHGGNGCSSHFPVERLFRDASILEIIEGSSQMQQEIIALYGLRKFYNNEYYKHYSSLE